ncbi:MAG: YceI family protein [Myxococcota bacterium]
MTWNIDVAHSELGFKIRHMMISKVKGTFETWTGDVTMSEGGLLEAVNAEVQVASINTRNGDRDNHLRSGDFFDAESWPTMTFTSTHIERTGGALHIKGNLTIRDQTRPVTLSVEQGGSGKDPWGNFRVGYSGKTTLSRKDFGLTWNQALETGGVLVGDEVEVEFEVQLLKPGS